MRSKKLLSALLAVVMVLSSVLIPSVDVTKIIVSATESEQGNNAEDTHSGETTAAETGSSVDSVVTTLDENDTTTAEETTVPDATETIEVSDAAELQNKINTATDGAIIVLTADITATDMVTVTAGKNVVIDFNGKTLYGSMLVEKGATADIKNGTINQNETVAGIEVQGVATLTDMNISSARHAIRVDGLSTEGTLLTVNSGTYQSNAPTGWTAHAINAGEGSTVIIKDGTFIGAGKANAGGSGNCVMVKDHDTTVTVEGGCFTDANAPEGVICPADKLTISGGSFGTWNYDNYLADGYVVVKLIDDETYAVRVEKFTAWSQVADTSWYNDTNTEFTLTTAEQLAGLAQLVNGGNTFAKKTVKLGANIDLANYQWTPIGRNNLPFNGVFDGGDHTIWNLSAVYGLENTVANNYIGLFGLTNSSAEIKNLIIENVTIKGSLYVGAIVGSAYTGKAITNCHVKGNIAIDAYWYAGVIAGTGYVKTVSGCTVNGNEGSYIKGNGGSYISGIMGQRGEGGMKIENCSVNNLEITAVDRVGGICGIAQYQNAVSDCSVTNVTITATDADAKSVGLIVGANNGDTAHGPSLVVNNSVKENVTANVAGTPVTTISGSRHDNSTIDASVVGTDVTFDESGEITGGNFEVAPPESTLAEGLIPVQNKDGSFGVVDAANLPVAEVNDVQYTNLQAAIDAANENAVITLLADVTETGVTVAVGKDVTIDLNGKTVTGSFMVYGSATIQNGTIDSTACGKSGIEVNNESDRTLNPTLVVEKLTIKSGRHAIRVDGGTVTIKSGSFTAADADSNHAVNISDGGKVTIEDGTFVGNTKSGTGAVAIRGDNSAITIENGTFTNGSTGSLAVWDGIAVVNGGTFDSVYCDCDVTITGGTFKAIKKFVGNNIITGGQFGEDPNQYLVDPYVAVKNGEFYEVVKVVVATVNGVGYATLEEALEAAASLTNPTVTLVKDVTVETWVQIEDKSGWTIDGNNCTITVKAVRTGNGEYLFHDADNFTVKNLTVIFETNGNGFYIHSGSLENVIFEGGQDSLYGISIGVGNQVTIENCTIENFKSYGVYADNYEGVANVIVSGTTISGSAVPVISYAQKTELTNNKISGGEISLAAGYNKAVENPTYVVTGNTFTDATVALHVVKDLSTVTFANNTVGDGAKLHVTEGSEGTLTIGANKWSDSSTQISAPEDFTIEIGEDGSGTVGVKTAWTGTGTEADPYVISDVAGLVELADKVNAGETFAGCFFKLASDIDLTGTSWAGIGIYKDNNKSFSGTFNGAGYTISNVTFTDASNGNAASEANNYRGLFNQIYQATVQNLTVSGHVWATAPTSTEYGGALLVGCAIESTIQNCVTDGTANGTHNVAGVVVRVQDSNIISCTNKANLTGSYSKMGGIAALVQNSGISVLFDSCINEGTITSTARGEDGVGGIVGWIGYPNTVNITVKNCENKGLITATATATVGQIAAESWNGGHIFTGNKGLANGGLATGHQAMSGLNFATVENGVATYVSTLEAGKTYLVTAPGVKPAIELAAGESITFDTTLATIDASGITAATELETATEGNVTTYTAVEVIGSKVEIVRDYNEETGKYLVYLFCGIDSLDYEEVGFIITVENKTVTMSIKSVYTKVTVTMVDGTERAFTASEFGQNVSGIFGQGIRFSNAQAQGQNIVYQSYAKKSDGTIIYGQKHTSSIVADSAQ